MTGNDIDSGLRGRSLIASIAASYATASGISYVRLESALMLRFKLPVDAQACLNNSSTVEFKSG